MLSPSSRGTSCGHLSRISPWQLELLLTHSEQSPAAVSTDPGLWEQLVQQAWVDTMFPCSQQLAEELREELQVWPAQQASADVLEGPLSDLRGPGQDYNIKAGLAEINFSQPCPGQLNSSQGEAEWSREDTMPESKNGHGVERGFSDKSP